MLKYMTSETLSERGLKCYREWHNEKQSKLRAKVSVWMVENIIIALNTEPSLTKLACVKTF